MVVAIVENGTEAKGTERRHLRAPETMATRWEVNRRAAEYGDIVDIMGKRHYPKPATDRVVGATEGPWAPDENAPPTAPVSRNPLQADEKMTRKERPGKRMTKKDKEQKPTTGVLPFDSESFDGPTQSRRMFFESQFLADHYAELLGRPARVEIAEERPTPRPELPLSVRRALESALPGGRGSEEVNNRIRAQVEAVVLQRYTRDLAKRYSRGDYALEEEVEAWADSGAGGSQPTLAFAQGQGQGQGQGPSQSQGETKKPSGASSNNNNKSSSNNSNSTNHTATANKKRPTTQEIAAAAPSPQLALPLSRASGRMQKAYPSTKLDAEFLEDDTHMQEDFGLGSSVVSSTFLASEEASTEVPGHFGPSLGCQELPNAAYRQGQQQHLPTLLAQQHEPAPPAASTTKEVAGHDRRLKHLS